MIEWLIAVTVVSAIVFAVKSYHEKHAFDHDVGRVPEQRVMGHLVTDEVVELGFEGSGRNQVQVTK
jgi:hypothetical protein